MTTWHIQKTGEDKYHVYGGFDEDVDGPKLMRMLHNRGLTDSQIGEVMSTLDANELGYNKTVTFES